MDFTLLTPLLFACSGTPSDDGDLPSQVDTPTGETGTLSTVDSAATDTTAPSTASTGATADTGQTLDPVMDFALRDTNPTSATFDQLVSPRDQIGRVSVWYFGHST